MNLCIFFLYFYTFLYYYLNITILNYLKNTNNMKNIKNYLFLKSKFNSFIYYCYLYLITFNLN